jgi:hypothetical protein
MEKYESPLTNIKIASPCSAAWDMMLGDERKRFCGDCRLHVYNLSGMTKYDAENLLRLSEGRLCVRFYQRPDGTILTQDCPVGWAKVKQRISIVASAAAALLIGMFGGLLMLASLGKTTRIIKKIPIPFVSPTPDPVIMGAIAMPSPSPTPDVKKMMGKPVRPQKIDNELREQVLRQAGV